MRAAGLARAAGRRARRLLVAITPGDDPSYSTVVRECAGLSTCADTLVGENLRIIPHKPWALSQPLRLCQ